MGKKPVYFSSPSGICISTKVTGAASGRVHDVNADMDSMHRRKLSKLMSKIDKAKDAAKRCQLEAKMSRLLTKLAAQPATVTSPALPLVQKPAFSFKPASILDPRSAVLTNSAQEQGNRVKRQQRFLSSQGDSDGTEAESSAEAMLIRIAGDFVGTSTALEKPYLRLTALPNAADVRPPGILRQALQLVKSRWLETSNYEYACEQLKSIRQDLTVQHVTDAVALDAYETHGRIALEVNDMAQFRQCHAVLRRLHAQTGLGSLSEFEAYNILFTLATARRSVAQELLRLEPDTLAHPFVQHALAVCSAVSLGDPARFLLLYTDAPRMSPYLMDRLLPSMQQHALQLLLVGHRPTPVPLEYVAQQLGLESREEAATFAEEHGAVVDRQAGTLDTKTSLTPNVGPVRPASTAMQTMHASYRNLKAMSEAAHEVATATKIGKLQPQHQRGLVQQQWTTSQLRPSTWGCCSKDAQED